MNGNTATPPVIVKGMASGPFSAETSSRLQRYPELEVLIPEDIVQRRTHELARDIASLYGELQEPLLMVGLLKGAFIFAADLARAIETPLVVDFMSVSSYGNDTESSGEVRIQQDTDESVKDRHVLLVEDIVDTGRTFSKVIELLKARGAASVKTCSLLDKPSRRVTDVQIDFCGFQIPDLFVVGCGLDYAGKFRHLPFVGVVQIP